MSKPSSSINLEILLKKQSEKFLLSSKTFQRQYISKLSSKIINTEMVYMEKFTRPKKLVIGEDKSSLILNNEVQTRRFSNQPKIETKFKRNFHTNLTFPARLSSSPLIVSSNTMSTGTLPPAERLVVRYSELFTSSSLSPRLKGISLRKTKKKLRNLCRKIKGIGTDALSERHKERMEIQMFAKNHEKKYLKEALRELSERKRLNAWLTKRI